MSYRTDKPYIGHIRDAAARALRYTQGLTQAKFQQDELVQDGVIRQVGDLPTLVRLAETALEELLGEHD